MWKSTRSKTKSESELSESESELSWLLICSAPSCWNWHPPLLFTLFSLKAIGGHKPHYWCLVEFGSAVQNKVCLAGCDSYCFINLPFKAAQGSYESFQPLPLRKFASRHCQCFQSGESSLSFLKPSRCSSPLENAFLALSPLYSVCFPADRHPWQTIL